MDKSKDSLIMPVESILIKEMCIAGKGTLTAGGTITPGCLVERTATGLLVPHSIVGGPSQRMIALEDLPFEIDENYFVNYEVFYKICRSGDQVYAFLVDGESTVIGDFLCSASNGVFKKRTLNQDTVLALALEAIEAVGDTRIIIEII